jgi:hypothetical protein
VQSRMDACCSTSARTTEDAEAVDCRGRRIAHANGCAPVHPMTQGTYDRGNSKTDLDMGWKPVG